MTVNDIIALARAGFSANQIAMMQQTFQQTAPAVQQPTQQTAPAVQDFNTEVLARLGALSTQISAAAINQSQQPPTQTVEDILAAVIAPPKKEG